jgi:hypothetical protein
MMELNLSNSDYLLILVFVIGWVSTIVTLKSDMKYVKARLKAGDENFRLLFASDKKRKADIASMQSACSAHHGTAFPDTGGNGE